VVANVPPAPKVLSFSEVMMTGLLAVPLGDQLAATGGGFDARSAQLDHHARIDRQPAVDHSLLDGKSPGLAGSGTVWIRDGVPVMIRFSEMT